MKVLWEVRAQGGDGKAIYGENYADIWAINRLHFAAAAGFSCDHVSSRLINKKQSVALVPYLMASTSTSTLCAAGYVVDIDLSNFLVE